MTTTNTPNTGQTARATLDMVERRLDEALVLMERWWTKQTGRTQLGVGLGALLVVALVLGMCVSSLGRATSSQAAPLQTAATAVRGNTGALAVELTPNDLGKTWSLNKAWQGNAPFDSEAFTVGAHWRVDWLFTPSQPGATLQVLIYAYAANGGSLLHIATNTHLAGADTSFWAGPGTYYLKVNSIGGDWKLDVQDLR